MARRKLSKADSNGSRLAGIGMTSARTRERLIQRLQEQGIANLEVLDRVRSVPRHLFVDEALSSRAYEDTALPIGFHQTISQPYIVARMTEAALAGGRRPKKVLEIGTGCGYQTAVLAPLVGKVYSIERIKGLHLRAKKLLKELGISNVLLKHGDGMLGWKSQAPFDVIVAAAAPLAVPEPLLKQLSKSGGRLIVPVGPEGQQQLLCISRFREEYSRKSLGAVSFVPLLGGAV
jgi:protein-L-isoaspartate(D-aspartate) O-methyltransferase